MATTETTNAVAQELGADDFSFMNGMEGSGFEDMGANAVSTAYLSMVQPGSSAIDENNPAGTWRNSASGKNYGSNVRVVVLAFRTIWNEREAEPPFRTVGRYPVGGIEVTIKQPPAGKRGYPKMINPETGNEVQELFIYAVALPDYPEDGVLLFSPTVGSMKTAKAWNSQLKGQLLPNGAQAPIFGFIWSIGLDLVQNPKKPTEQIAKFNHIERDTLISQELFTDIVQSQLAVTQQNVLQITSSTDAIEGSEVTE